MKQYITKEQWDKLTQSQKNIWYKITKQIYNENNQKYAKDMMYSNGIGQMMEFLGDYESRIIVERNNNEELCDALWEAVKNKLELL